MIFFQFFWIKNPFFHLNPHGAIIEFQLKRGGISVFLDILKERGIT